MKSKHGRFKGRRDGGVFAPWPRDCALHSNFSRLTFTARALLFELLGQFNGFNNGDLTCAYAVLRRRGWVSRTTIEKARSELEITGWLVRTRQGHRNRCSLYALTFVAIDDCHSKLDVPSGSTPLGFWKLGNNPWLERDKSTRPPPNSFALTSKRATVAQKMVKPADAAGTENMYLPTSCASQADEIKSPRPADGHLKELPGVVH